MGIDRTFFSGSAPRHCARRTHGERKVNAIGISQNKSEFTRNLVKNWVRVSFLLTTRGLTRLNLFIDEERSSVQKMVNIKRDLWLSLGNVCN